MAAHLCKLANLLLATVQILAKMAGAGKKRLQKARKEQQNSSHAESSTDAAASAMSNLSVNENSPQNLTPPSRIDGNKDPSAPRSRPQSSASHRSTGSAERNEPSSSSAPLISPTRQLALRPGTLPEINRNLDLGLAATSFYTGVST